MRLCKFWAIVAFIQKLLELTPECEQYQSLTEREPGGKQTTGNTVPVKTHRQLPSPLEVMVVAKVRCRARAASGVDRESPNCV